jgi:hypothetical protein
MGPMIRTLRNPSRVFAFAALTIVAICVVITRSPLFARNADVAAWGVTFDLTLTIPLVYYFAMVRTGSAKPITIAPVFVVCMMVAALVVPRGHQDFLHNLRFVSIPLELLTIALLARRIRGGQAILPVDQSRGQAGLPVLHAIVMGEFAILWYALFSWRKQPERYARSFTVHEESGWGTLVAGIVMLIVFESIGVHLLMQRWSVIAAWVVTGLDVYGVLWLLGDYHALRLRPSYVEDGLLHIRYGLRWSVDVPLDQIVDRRREERSGLEAQRRAQDGDAR